MRSTQCILFQLKGQYLELGIHYLSADSQDGSLLRIYVVCHCTNVKWLFPFWKIKRENAVSQYSRTSMAQTPIAHLPWLFQTHS